MPAEHTESAPPTAPPTATPAALLAAWLADRDAPCPRCGYNLRGLVPGPEARCPECDLPVELRLAEAEAPIGPWLLAFTACAMGLGFDSVVLLLITIMTVVSRGANADAFLGVLFLMLLLLAGGSLAALLRLRDARARWAHRSAHDRWVAAWGVFAAIFLVHLFSGLAFVAGVFFLG